MKKTLLATALLAALMSTMTPQLHAQAVQATGRAEVEVKQFKDQIAARAAARKMAERDAIRSALKLRLNIDASGPDVDAKIDDIVKDLTESLRSTFRTEGDVLTATAQLNVDASQLTDISRSLGLQNSNVMESASILFLVDEYWGVATNLDPSQALVSEVEYFHDKSSTSDTSAKSAGSSFSDTSAKAAASSSSASSFSGSSKQSASLAASERASVAGSRSASVAGTDSRALAAQDGAGGSLAAARNTSVAGSQRESFAGSSASSVAASRSSDTRVAGAQRASGSFASDQKNISAESYASDQKNVQTQNDVVSIKTKSVFPDVNNAKPSDSVTALIPQRLAEITGRFGLQYTPERDLRETGKGRMLISDIETQRRWDEYTAKAGKNPYNAKFVVYGQSVMSAEGRSASGQTVCVGQLKLESFSVATGRGLVAGTINKRAQGSSDQDCRSNLATALATELAQTVGNAATRQLQLIAAQGQSYTVTLFSTTALSRRLGGPFEDALRSMAGNNNVREDERTDATRVYSVAYKGGDFNRRLERVLDELGEAMRSAETAFRGNRVVICLEGKCPAQY